MGLWNRFSGALDSLGPLAALGLSVVNIVAVISLSEIAPSALQQHITWGVLLATLVVYGVGRWSVDCLWLRPWPVRYTTPQAAPAQAIQ